MTDDSTEFVPRHLRDGAHIGPPRCQWRRIANEYNVEQCYDPIDMAAGVDLCKKHIRRIGYMAGLMSVKRARETITTGHEGDIARLTRDVQRLNRIVNWQAKKLRGEPTDEPVATPERPKDGTIYALLSGYNVKIGWTSRDLVDRLREYPPNSTVLVAYPGKRGEETKLKRKFAHLRTHGAEWFPYAPQITEWVDQMVTKHGPPDPSWTCGPAKAEPPRPHADRPVLRPRDWRGSRPA